MKYQKMSLRDAFNKVNNARHVVRPNNGFLKQLITFEKNCGMPPSCRMVELPRDDVIIEVPDFFLKDHKKFVLLETLKAKAKKMKEIPADTSEHLSSSSPSNCKTQTPSPSSWAQPKKRH